MALTKTSCPHCGQPDKAPIPDMGSSIVDHSTNPYRGGKRWDMTTCENCGEKYAVKHGKA